MEQSAQNRDLTELVESHYAMLYRYAYRLTGSAADAEDLTQHTFLTAQTKLDQLRDPESARSWLFTIARNGYLKSLRSRPSAALLSLESVAEPEDEGGAGELEIDGERLQRVLNEMPEDFRTPIILFYFDEFSYKEIAGQMELPLGTVMSRLARGRAYLRRRLASSLPQTAGLPEDVVAGEVPATHLGKTQVGHELS
ncbi:MAG: RNA polymerase sigma factor [Planctomycetaceae bacterium]